ncbi:unnamed protein product [Penicillium manginii]
MGVDPETGRIIDFHHPLHSSVITDQFLAIPGCLGSCVASGVMIELLTNGHGPAGMIFQRLDAILILGILISKVMLGKSIPVIVIPDKDDFMSLQSADEIHISHDGVIRSHPAGRELQALSRLQNEMTLSTKENEFLKVQHRPAAQIAMEVLVSYAALEGAPYLIDISQAHIDACCYLGPRIDQLRWRELETESGMSTSASLLADVYAAMDAQKSFTHAPYLLDTAPQADEQIGWAESNTVIFANTVLGARTQKYPGLLDVFISLTGRAPYVGCHTTAGRLPKLCIDIPPLFQPNDSVFPLLGYYIGQIAGSEIPLVRGMEALQPIRSDMKAFCAGFATTSSAAMVHIKGLTPEATGIIAGEEHLPVHDTSHCMLAACYSVLNSATDASIDLVSLGNPHFSLEEFALLTILCQGRRKNSSVELVITTNRTVYQHALNKGYIQELEDLGGKIHNRHMLVHAWGASCTKACA